MFFSVLFFLLLGCFVSWLVIQVSLSFGLGQKADAAPQHHHTHTGVVPRIGGVGIIAGFSVIYLLSFFLLGSMDQSPVLHYAVFGGAGLAFLLGFIDDCHPLGARVKLLVQILIGLGAYLCGLSFEKVNLPPPFGQFDLGFLSLGMTVFWFVAMMNLINLIDGLDGLAGGIGLMLMSLLAFLGFQNSVAFSTILALGMVGAILGFLFHNFPPAKAYMGDSGAYLIGFVIAAISIINSQKGTVIAAMIAPVLALALPITDVVFAMLRRYIKGLPLFRPDRNHIHHRLMRSGLSHRNTVMVLYGISLLALLGSLLVVFQQGRVLAILLGFLFVVILFALRGQQISARSVHALLSESLYSRQDTRNALFLRNWLIVEAERADSVKNLWSDFRFVLKKMGFCRAELKIGEETRSFYVPNTPHDQEEALWQETHEISGLLPIEFTLYAEKDNLSQRQFQNLADIAVETLGKTAVKWKETNGSQFDFQAVAAPSKSYRTQKVRGLYRPTY